MIFDKLPKFTGPGSMTRMFTNIMQASPPFYRFVDKYATVRHTGVQAGYCGAVKVSAEVAGVVAAGVAAGAYVAAPGFIGRTVAQETTKQILSQVPSALHGYSFVASSANIVGERAGVAAAANAANCLPLPTGWGSLCLFTSFLGMARSVAKNAVLSCNTIPGAWVQAGAQLVDEELQRQEEDGSLVLDSSHFEEYLGTDEDKAVLDAKKAAWEATQAALDIENPASIQAYEDAKKAYEDAKQLFENQPYAFVTVKTNKPKP